MNPELTFTYHGVERARFAPHYLNVEEGRLTSPRRGRPWPIPIGAEIRDGGRVIGVVTKRARAAFQRCEIWFEPAVDEAEDETEAEEAPAVVSSDGPESPESPKTSPPLYEELLSERTIGILAEHDVHDVEALRELLEAEGDEGILALSGVGPATLEEIKAALEIQDILGGEADD